MRNRLKLYFVILSFVISAASTAHAAYTFTEVDYPGAVSTQALGINNSGNIVGSYTDSIGTYGFLYAGGTFTTIDFPGANKFTLANGINNSGDIVGSYRDANNRTHGFLYSGGFFTSIDFPGASTTSTNAGGINDSGNIVGSYTDTNLRTHGFLYAGGTFTTIDFPGANLTSDFGINNSGDIVGSYSDANDKFHGLLYAGGTFTTIDFPGTTYIGAVGINNSGDIVGYYDGTTYYGFLYAGGTFASFYVYSGASTTFTNANGINDSGEIVGSYYDGAYRHGFLTTYAFTAIDDPVAVAFATGVTEAHGINDPGNIVGSYYDGTGSYGFLYSGGTFTLIAKGAAASTFATGINNSGNIVGYYIDGTGNHSFLFGGGSFTALDVPGAIATFASGINNSSDIVGYYDDAMGIQYGFLYAGGKFTSVVYPGATDTLALGINDSGSIVGQYRDVSGNYHGFLYAGGTFTTIDFPGANLTSGFGINNSGDIVGYYDDAMGTQHGFFYAGGTFTSVDYPGALSTRAYGINNSGDIAGSYVGSPDSKGKIQTHGFLITPSIPETVSIPTIPSGPASGITGTPYSYSTGGSTSSLGNPVEYQYDWKGDGTDLSAYGSSTQSKTWTAPGTYNVRVRARDKVNTSVVSDWSPALSVTISAAGPVINISVAPTSVTFGNVNVGQASNQTITIANQSGSTAALTGNVGALSTPFSVMSGGGAFNLSPGQSVTVTIRFSPTTAGAASTNLSITHNATNQTSPTKISLSGTGVSSTVPVISITPTSNDYGNVKVKRSKTASFVVKNSGKANLSITSTTTGADASMFKITSGSGSKTIKPGRTLTIRVAFKPTSTGSKSAILEIDSNDPSTPTTDIPLSGTGQ